MSHSAAVLGHREEMPDIPQLRGGQAIGEVEHWCALDQAGETVDQLNLKIFTETLSWLRIRDETFQTARHATLFP